MKLSDIRFEVWIDGNGRNPDGTQLMEGRVMMRCDRPDSAEGLRSIWFFMHEDDLQRFEQNSWGHTLEDGNHRMNISGDRVVFYDFEIPISGQSGVMQVPYVSIQIASQARRVLARVIRGMWSKLRAGYTEERKYSMPRIEFQLTERQASRLERYGQGSGQVEMIIDERATGMYEMLRCVEDFQQKVRRLQTIARNSTIAPWQIAKVYLWKDSDGFYFTTKTPKNHQTLCGGLVNHSREGGHDWSIHT